MGRAEDATKICESFKEFDGVSFVPVPISACARSVTPTFSFRPASSEHIARPVYFCDTAGASEALKDDLDDFIPVPEGSPWYVRER